MGMFPCVDSLSSPRTIESSKVLLLFDDVLVGTSRKAVNFRDDLQGAVALDNISYRTLTL
jgi:hypothetical protein